MCLSCRHFGHFVLIRFFFWFFSYCWQVSVCDCVLPFEIISSVQHPDSNQWPHLFLSQQTHDFWALVLVHHTCPSVCHLSSLTSTFPSCSLLFAANALMSQSDSNSRVCVCFNVCTRLSFPSLAGFLSFPWWETRVPKELANVKSQSRLTENLLGNVCVCVCETIISGPAERPAVLLFSHQTSVPPPLWPQHPILCSVTSSVCASLQVSNQEAHMYCFSCHTAGNISGYKMFSPLVDTSIFLPIYQYFFL